MVDAENNAAIRLLEKPGLNFERMVRMPGEPHDIKLFATSVK